MTMKPPALIAFLLVLMVALQALAGESDMDLDEMLEGFDQAEPLQGVEMGETLGREDALADLYGSLTISSMFRTEPQERNRLAELKSELDLKVSAAPGRGWRFFANALASHDFACHLNNDPESDYCDDVEREIALQELWVEKSFFPWLDLKLGQQIIAWGTSDSFRVVDVVNPVDQRRFAMTDIEDIRLGQAMTRFDIYSGPWNFTFLMIHGDRRTKTAEEGSDFYPSDITLPPLDGPEYGLGNTRFAGALTGRFSGWDAGLYLARVHDDASYVSLDGAGNPVRLYPKITMAGATLTRALGSTLVKTEAAYLDGLRFSGEPDREMSGLDILVGADYTGFTDTTLTLEVVNRHILSFEQELAGGGRKVRRNRLESALRVARDFRNDTLQFTLVAGFFGETGDLGSFQRVEAEYDWSDTLFFKLGAVFYHGGGSPLFERIEHNDRVFFSICKDFS
ncbi:MAG: DUF1302 domain-containing protein [Desulfobacteraceae bacterium]|nr:DUF1302 domain-containing protein [Desulfobacteraceae bacterium]